MEGVII